MSESRIRELLLRIRSLFPGTASSLDKRGFSAGWPTGKTMEQVLTAWSRCLVPRSGSSNFRVTGNPEVTWLPKICFPLIGPFCPRLPRKKPQATHTFVHKSGVMLPEDTPIKTEPTLQKPEITHKPRSAPPRHTPSSSRARPVPVLPLPKSRKQALNAKGHVTAERNKYARQACTCRPIGL